MPIVRHLFLLLALFLALASLGQGALDSLNQPGVPFVLASFRSACLKDIRYDLVFHIPAAKEQPVTGEEILSFQLDSARGAGLPLLLDFKGTAVHAMLVNGTEITPEAINEHLQIPSRLLRSGANSVQTLFTSSNAPLNRNTDFLYTLLVPDRARTLFPCFDQPDCKAVFTLSLTLPDGWKAIANAPLMDSAGAGDPGGSAPGGARLRFRPSDKISTYLFSFAAGKFSQAMKVVDGRPMTFLYRETDPAKLRLSLDSIFRIEGQALQFLQGYTAITYPFQKFDFVAIPDFQFGGMEHVGAIQYKASTLFLDSGATREQFISRSNLLAHETAHMWFGDWVTMSWFNDVWMKEVFANFMADKLSNLTIHDNNYDLKFLTDHYPAAYSIDRTGGAHPIRQALTNLNEAGSLYGNIIYHKAPIVMRQLEQLMGPGPFRDGLRDYLKRYAGGNASWPDLIHALQSHTTLDLTAWNAVWVNGAGRPKFSYDLIIKNDKISDLTISQHGEDSSERVWPQLFNLALIHMDGRVEELTVNSNAPTIHVQQVVGKAKPRFILLNSDGRGYGVFPGDYHAIGTTPLMHAASYIDQYENMLNGGAPGPWPLFLRDLGRIKNERDELVLNVLLEQMQSIYWRFLPPFRRNVVIEQHIWDAMKGTPAKNNKKLLFRAFSNMVISKRGMDSLYGIWKNKQPPAGVVLSEDDYTNLAAALALRNYPGYKAILEEQLTRISNTDRRQRLQYLLPSLSNDEAERDRFFNSLQSSEARRKEAWVLAALGYLHHPLRAEPAIKYLQPSLDWLEDIQRTGDVFFPQSWLQASFGLCRTPAEMKIVRSFLEEHPDYNPKLKAKILQAADNLFRAEKLH
jgi:aminopeptidase N